MTNELFVPDLLWPESGNILWKKVQRGELMADESASDLRRTP
jgi:hypothetical protein